MAHYLARGAYTPEAWAALLKNPQNRFALLPAVLEKLGARLEAAYFTFGYRTPRRPRPQL
jgi:uncharacterized protein with GYD domain